ncbi:hypothetical protein ILUMI_26914 [Ignelater luminosus]|uniref:Endonuclease/exonuclease/phosphatase domain-containing protein n=1 Tax=Ignelater luminosus TaxID=2038154 RepID=A0A8K0FYH4_IGNLU|nr:hypothetical protein ILUMI_26914 [Ignelater luminosus]
MNLTTKTKRNRTTNSNTKIEQVNRKNKTKWKMETWNVRRLNGKECELIESLNNSKIEIVALSETEKKGTGSIWLNNGDLLICGGVGEKDRARGVDTNTRNKYRKNIITIVIIYGPDEDEGKIEKSRFWESLQKVCENKEGKVITAGDLNAREEKDADKPPSREVYNGPNKTVRFDDIIVSGRSQVDVGRTALRSTTLRGCLCTADDARESGDHRPDIAYLSPIMTELQIKSSPLKAEEEEPARTITLIPSQA